MTSLRGFPLSPIRPKLLCGLGSFKLPKPDLLKLEKYKRDFLHQIQHLLERVAMCSVYILSGLLPIEAAIHRSQLTLFGNIVRQDSVERDLAIQQLAVRTIHVVPKVSLLCCKKHYFAIISHLLMHYWKSLLKRNLGSKV